MSASIVTILLISVAAVVAENLEDVARLSNARIVRRIATTRLAQTLADEETRCEPDKVTCEKGQLTFCGMDNAPVTIPCSYLFDGKPGYCDCDSSQCVPERPVCPQEEDLRCSREGEKLPDPKDCQQFTYCDGSTKAVLRCPNGFVYSPGNRTCQQGGTCSRLSCNPKRIEWLPFPQAPQYFLFCIYGRGEVRQCSQEGYEMRGGKCQFRCLRPGLFQDPNPDSCRKGTWYACTKKGNTIVKETMNCGKVGGEQRYFDEKIGVCTKADPCGSDSQPPQGNPPAPNPPSGGSQPPASGGSGQN